MVFSQNQLLLYNIVIIADNMNAFAELPELEKRRYGKKHY